MLYEFVSYGLLEGRTLRCGIAPMIEWDDVRYFLARLARRASVRAAAGRLGVNHSTVLRRVAQLEERLGAQMFDKLPSGYRLTAAGEEVLELAKPDGSVIAPAGDARSWGRDQSVRGLLRVTLAPPLANTPAHAGLRRNFARLHPDLENGNSVVRRTGKSD